MFYDNCKIFVLGLELSKLLKLVFEPIVYQYLYVYTIEYVQTRKVYM